MPVYAGAIAESAMMMEGHYPDDFSSGSQGAIADFRNLMAELKSQNYDVIRFATYRTACKLRFLQKKTSLHLVDIWNIIEAFRENGLNSPEPRMELNVSRLETLLSSIFYQLNKRLPASQQIDLGGCTSLLLNWFLATYDPDGLGKVRVFSIKIALSVMCAGKLVDKLRYIFSLISDANALLLHNKFADFLKEAVALPCSVCESPTFGYIDSLPASIFDPHSKATVNDFLDTFMLDPSPPCLMWLSLLHRLANVENVLHPVLCDGCNRESFLGFRYKCQRCYSYQLCQDCFWRGRTSGNHSNTHEMKEYTSYKSPSKQLSHSLKKSFRCVPEKQPHQNIPRFPPEPEKRFNLSHIVPPSPIPSHNGFPELMNHSYDMSSLDSRSLSKSFESSREDEHRLIARYAARLADTESSMRSPSDYSLSLDSSRQKDLISQLESKNREIMREIMRLRKQQEREDAALQSEQNPTLLAELRGLRQRKEELENHLSTLQESRRELMVQLEALMKLLKNHQASPRSTPNSSPRSGTSKSPPLSTPYPLSTSSRSAPTTPGSNPPTTDSLTGVGGDVRMAFGQSGSSRSLRNDLLVAADSVTNAMSSLVRELNSEDEDGGGDSKVFTSRDFETEDTESAVESLDGGGTLWREERQRAQEDRFIAEIQARNLSATITTQSSVTNNGLGGINNGHVVTTASGASNINNVTTSSRTMLEETGEDVEASERLLESGEEDDEDDDPELYDNDPKDLDVFQRHASLTTDDESYVRTDDDDDGGNTDWEDSMRRWVNR